MCFNGETLQPRGANLDPGRRLKAQKNYYEKNKEKVLEQQRQRRVKLYDTLQGLGKFAYSKLQTDSQQVETSQIRKSIYQEIYGDVEKYDREEFIGLDSPPTFDTFPRFVVWFLDRSLLPPIHTAIPGLTLIFDIIPKEFHYQQVIAILHQDSNLETSSENLQSLLDAAFELWRPYLETPELASATALDDKSLANTNRRGPTVPQRSGPGDIAFSRC